MKNTLLFSLILLSSAVVGQTGTTHFTMQMDSIYTITQTNGHGLELATKKSNGKWIILNADSLMEYEQREQTTWELKYFQVQRKYSKQVDDYNKLVDDYNHLLGNFKTIRKAYTDQSEATKEMILKILALNKK